MNLPDPVIEPGSPALQVDSSPTELSGKPSINLPQVIVIDTIHLPIQWPFSSVFFAVLFSYRDRNAPNMIFQPSLWLGIATTPSFD